MEDAEKKRELEDEKLKKEIAEVDASLRTMDDFVAPEELYQELLRSVRKYHPSTNLDVIGKAYQTVISTVIGVILKSLLTFLLLEPFGIYGAPIATNIAYPVMFIINLLYIKKYLGFVPNFVDILVKPLFAGIACWAAAWGTLKLFDMWNISQKIALFPAIIFGAIVYIALLFALKLVTINEIKQVMKKK